MRILMVTAEYAPLAKTGGLADAVAGLSRALVANGHQVCVVLPCYAHLRNLAASAATGQTTAGTFHVLPRQHDEPEIRLYDTPRLYDDAAIYTGDDRDAARFIALSEAAAGLASESEFAPDVVHCHDWHAALVPALLKSRGTAAGDGPAVVLSLHNVGYQGVFGIHVLGDERYERLRALIRDDRDGEHTVNFLRTGIRAARSLTTVSPTYAHEVQSPEFGMGLEDVLSERAADLHGILNGVDYSHWNPASDPHIPHAYDAGDPAPKRDATTALRQRMELASSRQAVVGLVSRITYQKGIELVADALPELLEHSDAQFALLGTGDGDVVARLADIARAWPGRVGFVEGYDETLAHLIFAGSDLLLVPSRYEPCGLTQLYAMKYGTIPVVRRTGGLADTVVPFDPVSGQGNGAVFGPYSSQALADAIRDALRWHADPASRMRIMRNAMHADFSWARQVHEYERIYAEASSSR